LVMHRSWRKVK